MPTAAPTPLDAFADLARLIMDAERETQALARRTHANFNVFTTLLREDDEVRLHTRFLHGLLNPRGSHDCGARFLDLFFETLSEIPPVDHLDQPVEAWLPDGPHEWTIFKETRCGNHGQIDLLLTAGDCAIAIENKIYADEQPRQIADYHDYLRGSYARPAPVLYLTLDAKLSATADGRPYLRISYRRHILNWLDRCSDATRDIPQIHHVINQYRALVQKITGQTLDAPHMKPAIDLIRSNPDIISCRRQIDTAIAEVRAEFLDQIASGLIQRLSPRYRARLRPRLIQNRFGKDGNGAIILHPPADSPLARFEVWVEHIAKWKDGLVVGIETAYDKPPLPAEDQALLARMNRLLVEHGETTGYHKANPLATWPKTWWPTGWHNLVYPFDDQKLVALLKEPFEEIANQLADDVRAHIALLEKLCRTAMKETVAPAD